MRPHLVLLAAALFLGACSDDAADALRAEAAALDRTLAEKQMLSDTRESRQDELAAVRKVLADTAPLDAADLRRALPRASLATERPEGFSKAWVFVGASRSDLLETLEAAGNLHPHVVVSIIEWGPRDWTITLTSASIPPPRAKTREPRPDPPCTGECVKVKARVEALRAKIAALEAGLGELNSLLRYKKEAEERLASLSKRDHALLQPASDLVANLDPPRTMQLRLAPNQFDLR